MKVVLTDGTELSCRNFRAIESGVLLTKDKKRKKVVGFVPTHQLRYVVRDDVEPVAPADVDARATGESDDELRISQPAPADPGESAVFDDTGEPGGDPATESDLRRLGGLGSTYAERLQSAGFETLSDLAAADPVVVAEAAAVAPGRGRRWVNAAIRATGVDEQGATDAETDGEIVSDHAEASRPAVGDEDEPDADRETAGEDGEADGDEGDLDEEAEGGDTSEHDTAEEVEDPEDDA